MRTHIIPAFTLITRLSSSGLIQAKHPTVPAAQPGTHLNREETNELVEK